MNVNTNIIPIISIVAMIVFSIINMYMNIKIKFATTQAELTHHAKNLFLNIALVLIVCVSLYFLFSEFSSPTALDKRSLSNILFYSFSICIACFFWFIWKIIKIMHKFILMQQRFISLQEKSITNIEENKNSKNK